MDEVKSWTKLGIFGDSNLNLDLVLLNKMSVHADESVTMRFWVGHVYEQDREVPPCRVVPTPTCNGNTVLKCESRISLPTRFLGNNCDLRKNNASRCLSYET